jgi:hypothetical protein
MKRIGLVLLAAVVCLTASAMSRAEDNPLIGKWKLNVEKSKFTPASVTPKSQTRTVEADGDSVKYSFEVVSADGKSGSYGFTVKYDGKFYAITGTGAPYGADEISIKKATSHSYNAILKRGGKEVASSHLVLSKDGKTATLTGKGTDASGKPVSSTSIYDKE